MNIDMPNKKILSMSINNESFSFDSTIQSSLENVENELSKINETIESVKNLKPECDKLDYVLAASSGALCGMIDIFLIGKPGESPVGKITDKWFEERTKDFARINGWSGDDENLSSAIRSLEKKYKIPYDQNGIGEATLDVLGLNPSNHHFKSLGHNPTLLGLFFSILDQFTNSSHFVSDGKLISLEKVGNECKLKGNDIPSKFLCAFANWFGHIISDISGSSSSKGRGMGIPSPIISWINDIIVLKNHFNIPINEITKSINEIALNIYEEGFDVRFQTTQMIPIFINELIVRFIYSIRRAIKYLSIENKEKRTFELLWKKCEPFSNNTVKRMLTVAHGTFCLMDFSDATIKGVSKGYGTFNIQEFLLHLNIAGIGRFTISLYGETHRALNYSNNLKQIEFAKNKKTIILEYIDGLNELSKLYNDKQLLIFVNDLKSSEAYKSIFDSSVELAKMRKVPENKIIKNKSDIDLYFKNKGSEN